MANIGTEQIETNAELLEIEQRGIGLAEALAFNEFIRDPSPATIKALVASRRATVADVFFSISERIIDKARETQLTDREPPKE